MREHGSRMPDDISQLQSYLPEKTDPALLARYRMGAAREMDLQFYGSPGKVITQVGPVDEDYDNQFVISSQGMASMDYAGQRNMKILQPVYEAYSAAHPGDNVDDPSVLLPFATTQEQKAVIMKEAKDYLKRSYYADW